MERKVPFSEGELYHLFTRGVEKRDVFMSKNDYERFMLLLLLCNDTKPVKIGNSLRKPPEREEPSPRRKNESDSRNTIVDIIAYALMPNHVHFLV